MHRLEIVKSIQQEQRTSDPDIIETCPVGIRRDHVMEMCRKWPQIVTMDTADHIITDPMRKLLYCEVSKVACTKVKHTWELANTNLKDINPVLVHDLDILEASGLYYTDNFTLDNKTSEYTKFMVVRHPMDRLISAYKNLLNYNGNGPYYAIQPMIDLFHLNRIEELSFAMFLYAVSNRNFEAYNDPHWQPYSFSCNPCAMKYDYIVRTETMQNDPDMIKVLEKMQYTWSDMESIINPGERAIGETSPIRDGLYRTDRRYQQWLKGVPEQILRDIHHRYRDDFLLFGYTFDIADYSFSCEINHNGKICC